MRLIDADAIPWTDLNDNPNSKIRVLITFADKVNRMPTIEPERKKGEWIKKWRNGFGNEFGHCNQCDRSYEVSNFCPNCGAEMSE